MKIGVALILLVASACSGRWSANGTDLGAAPPSAPRLVQEADHPPELYAPRSYRLSPGELVLAADDDDIPAIFAEDDLFLGPAAGSLEWSDDELVIGAAFNGEARAYPVRLLSSHEIVNDTIGGTPVAVTWCPLCFSAMVFDRRSERELTFGVSGYLFRNNLVMVDHQTGTYWSQLLAQAIRGPLRESKLRVLPSQLITWGEWKELYPATRVLSAERVGYGGGNLVDPYTGYYLSGTAGLTGGSTDGRLRPKSLVVGVVAGDQARAYPIEEVRGAGVINDTFVGIPLVLVLHPDSDSVSVFRRDPTERILTFRRRPGGSTLQDLQTGSIWEPRTGLAIEGELSGRRLTRLAAPLVFWFAWSDLYRSSQVYGQIP